MSLLVFVEGPCCQLLPPYIITSHYDSYTDCGSSLKQAADILSLVQIFFLLVLIFYSNKSKLLSK